MESVKFKTSDNIDLAVNNNCTNTIQTAVSLALNSKIVLPVTYPLLIFLSQIRTTVFEM